ncbi:cbb3-type cytochrome c oxidase subunit 3 [Luteimonas yindakuii]|uniref:Cbb3-type cytochrome c oxidase subunit 3 n=1 Tax=Luteimonas yindakuii TaxID=2565782 RepID=A0A4Z1REZ6_9GAMM|nr:cbb3-type cytochrome c oxidase subunit 3 [Luteimonas yindakuii]QCO68320.1 cbb3-type cytochrome c oxidase subunit 3 [Luteimonas yindakuii]TKS54723.1 cbb3-type cytochrome c oxidase subunit 3 [Luteimonas yindakuii]
MVSGIVTVILLLLFVGGWIWAWSPRRKRDFDEAARLPLADDTTPGADDGADAQASNEDGETKR